MKLLKKTITAVAIAAIFTVGSVGFTVQSGTSSVPALGTSTPVELQDEARAGDCIRAERRECGWFSCWCEGPTTRECEGCGDEARLQ